MHAELTAAQPLDPEHRADLAELVEETRRRRQREFDEALDEAVGHLPRLVRGPARRALFGGGS